MTILALTLTLVILGLALMTAAIAAVLEKLAEDKDEF